MIDDDDDDDDDCGEVGGIRIARETELLGKKPVALCPP
jgi:hypothetical protein